MTASLKIQNLCLKINENILVDNIICRQNEASVIALIGNNGCGKTTLLHSLAGLNENYSKNIWLDGQALSEIPLKLRAEKLVLLQQASLQKNSCLAKHRIAHGLIPFIGFDWLDRTNYLQIINIAERLGILHLINRPLNQMSGGEQRLVEIAKTLINHQASLILLDEPSVFLDLKQKKILAQNIRALAFNKIIIFSSHDLDFIAQCANQIWHIDKQKIAYLKPNQILSSFGSRLSSELMAEATGSLS